MNFTTLDLVTYEYICVLFDLLKKRTDLFLKKIKKAQNDQGSDRKNQFDLLILKSYWKTIGHTKYDVSCSDRKETRKIKSDH